MDRIPTQIRLTKEQRRGLDARRQIEGKTLSAVVRDAVDAYLERPDMKTYKEILDRTFGIDPDFTLQVPRSEWSRREKRIWGRRRA